MPYLHLHWCICFYNSESPPWEVMWPGHVCWLLGFLSTWQKLWSFWNRALQLRKCHQQNGLWTSLWYIFLAGDWWGRAQLSSSGSISINPPLPLFELLPPDSCLEFLPWLPLVIELWPKNHKWNYKANSCLPNGFIIVIEALSNNMLILITIPRDRPFLPVH